MSDTSFRYLRVELEGVYVLWMQLDEKTSISPVTMAASRLEAASSSMIGRRRREAMLPGAAERIKEFRAKAGLLKGTGWIAPFKVSQYLIEGFSKSVTRQLNDQELLAFAGKVVDYVDEPNKVAKVLHEHIISQRRLQVQGDEPAKESAVTVSQIKEA